MNKHLDVNARVSVSAHYLRGTNAQELLRGRVDFGNTPGLRFAGAITERHSRDDGKIAFVVALDDLPDHSFTFLSTCLRYEGPRTRTVRPIRANVVDMPGSEGLLEDAEVEVEEEEEEAIDLTSSNQDEWKVDEVTTDYRLTSLTYEPCL